MSEFEYKYKHMKTIQGHNVRLLNENKDLREQLKRERNKAINEIGQLIVNYNGEWNMYDLLKKLESLKH